MIKSNRSILIVELLGGFCVCLVVHRSAWLVCMERRWDRGDNLGHSHVPATALKFRARFDLMVVGAKKQLINDRNFPSSRQH
jgi:hypothetical protein